MVKVKFALPSSLICSVAQRCNWYDRKSYAKDL